MKKVLSVVLALVMMLSAVSIMTAAKADCDYTMTYGETRTVTLPGAVYDDFVIVKFVSKGSGKVIIASDIGVGINNHPVLEVFKGSLSSANLIGKNEGNSLNHNFKYELNCEANTTYFLAMHNSLSAKSWDVSITCLHEVYEDGKCTACNADCPHIMADNIVGCCPCGEAFTGEEITVGKTVTLKSSKNRVWYRFTPTETAPAILVSSNPDDGSTWIKKSADPAFVIVDETGTVVLADNVDVSSADDNFNFPYLFEKGERYFIGLSDENTGSDDWKFTLASGTVHTIEVETEETRQVVDEDGNLVFEQVKKQAVDAEGNPVVDAEGNPVYETVKNPVLDADGNPVLDADGNAVYEEAKDADGNPVYVYENGDPVYETVTVMVPVNHRLEYVGAKAHTCQATGHTPKVVCPDCKDADGNATVIAGGDEIAKAECKDDNGDYKCDWCGTQVGEPPVEEDPTKDCTCACHKDGISKFFFDFKLFFQKIFRLNSVCSCGVRHY